MKLPLAIARRHVQLPEKFEDLLDIISTKIGAIESYIDLSKKYENILIAQIKEKNDHPDAEKLGVYKISIGKGDLIQVVAGDKDLNIDDKIAYIKPGGTVPSTYQTDSPIVISALKMRGVMSNGMMCSEKELAIGTNSTCVLKLPENATVGVPFAQFYELDDCVIDIENKALTNRADLFGIIGLAREIAGAQGIKFESPKWYKEPQIELAPSKVCLNLDIDNKVEPLCPRYSAIVLSNVKIEDSPIWLKSALLKSGIKPINNVVDITNYIMIVTGQPMHAFDFDKVVKTDTDQADMGHIVVRTAKDQEKIHALDGNIYTLTDSTLVIANSQHPIAIAGIIGGVDTEIDQSTKNLILESANFDRYNLRRTSMELGIVTESSTRFTKSQSPNMCLPILAYAVELILETASGDIASTLLDSYKDPKKTSLITVDINRLNSRLGLNMQEKEVTSLLENIEYTHTKSEDRFSTFEIPPFREDIEIEEDVYEDIVRLFGYEKIDSILPKRDIKATHLPKMLTLKNKIREILSNSGCNELLTYNFLGSTLLQSVKQDPNVCMKLINPLSKEFELMRPSILASLLDKAKLNTKEGVDTFSIFEIGLSHQKDILDKEKLPLEQWKLALVFSDNTKQIEGNPYYQAKRYLEKLLEGICLTKLKYTLISDLDYESIPQWSRVLLETFESNSSAMISTTVGDSDVMLGLVGEINNEIKENLSLNDFTSAFEINLQSVLDSIVSQSKYTQASKFPYITRDICFVVDNKVTYSELLKSLKEGIEKQDIKYEMKCLDIYKEKDSSSRNITMRISLSNKTKTLDEKEYQQIRAEISKKLTKLNISILQ